MKKPQISIVGSKPNAKIVRSDYYYCANSAASFYENQINKNKGFVTTLVAASEIIESKRKNNLKKKWLSEKFERITNAKSNQIILIGNEIFPDAYLKLSKKYKKKIILKSFNDINDLLESKTNLSFPILTYDHFFPLSVASLNNIHKYLKELFLKKTKTNHLLSGLFRPSTGIISLLYAISIHGNNAIYDVCGIGLRDRDKYPDGFNNTWTPKKNMNIFHVYADKKICQVLNSKYDINFHDKSFKL